MPRERQRARAFGGIPDDIALQVAAEWPAHEPTGATAKRAPMLANGHARRPRRSDAAAALYAETQQLEQLVPDGQAYRAIAIAEDKSFAVFDVNGSTSLPI